MFGDGSGGILHRHFPPGKVGKAGAVVGVPLVETRFLGVHIGSFWPEYSVR
jgi:hypothetical protein